MKICLDKSLQYKFPFFCCEIISHFTFLTVQFLGTIIGLDSLYNNYVTKEL